MKKIFLLTSVVFNLSASITIAQTNVPGGLVSGTWTLAGSPYLIQGSVQIPNDSTLTIKPGVTIIFQGTYKLNVQGRLLAIGTNVDTIVFTAANISNGWRGIRFNGTSAINDSSKVIYCKLQYGKANGPSPDDNGGALYFNNFSKTIISNCLISNCTANTSGGGIYCSVSNPMIINNFITKNSISNNTNYWHSGGGGIFCTGSSPNISNNTITYNVAPFGCGCGDEGGGGGICCMDSNPIINNNTISNNTASGGGGIYSTGSPTITNNTISYNISSNDGGGGICCDEFGGSPIISNNFISNNTAFSTGGGILTDVFSSITNNTLINNSALNGGAISFYRAFSSILSNNVISNNSATSVGGALYCSEGCFPTITNNTITNNMASNGGALYCDQGSNPTFRNCILYGNNASKSGMQVSLFDDASDPGFYYCDVQGGSAAFELNGNFYGGTYQNNINADPLFVEPSSGSGSNYNGEIADWSLQNGSPCINAGDSTITNYPATDLAGNPRLTFSRIEIGAYEYQAGLSFNVSLNILQSILCNDDTTGEVAAIASGGSLPYTYLWSNGQTTANAIGLAAGIYRVRVTEASYGWTITKSITLTQPPALLVNAGLDKYIICRGTVELDSITSNYNGSGLLSYLWSPATGLNYDTIPNPIATVTNNTKYFVTVSTPNGCIAKDSVKVTVNPLTVNGEADKTIICGGKVQFDNPITNYTGSGTLSYSWLPKEGLDSAKLAQPTAEIISDKTYTLSVSTPNGCITKDSVKVTVIPLIAIANDITVSCGNTAQLDVTTNYTGSGSLIYNWVPASGLSSTIIANPIATLKTKASYSVDVKTPNGCYATDNINVSTSVISFNPSICMVTVNDNDKNVVVWQREQNTAIDTFYIYRESSIQTGQYDIIGNLPYSATGVFVDTGSNARIQSNKYKIAIKDVCGFITDKSSEHKTMHLTINKGVGNTWNLIWEQYIGVPVSSYRIYRGTTKANLAQIGSSSGSNTTYTDETAPAGDVYYQIEVVLPQACTNLKSTGYASSLSNIISSADVVTGISVNSVTQTFIYPNPAFDMLNIKNVHSLNATIMIFDLQGKQILNKQIVSGQIDISNFSKGIYIIKLIDSGNVLINKFVKE